MNIIMDVSIDYHITFALFELFPTSNINKTAMWLSGERTAEPVSHKSECDVIS
jgi:hypothetical protein